jgi:hypothetical protein
MALENALKQAIKDAVNAAIVDELQAIIVKETQRALRDHEDELTQLIRTATATAISEMLNGGSADAA